MIIRPAVGTLILAAALAGLPLSTSLAQGSMGMTGAATPAARGPAYDPNREFHAGTDALAAGKFRPAKTKFEHVLAMIPDHPAALYLLAQAEAGLGDWRGAARDDAASLHADPHQVFAARDLALADEKLGRHDQAAAQLQKLQQRAQACGDSCAEAGDLQGAVRDVEAAMSQPDQASAKTH